MTVLPYLVDHYYESRSEDGDIQYFTEHQLNGNN